MFETGGDTILTQTISHSKPCLFALAIQAVAAHEKTATEKGAQRTLNNQNMAARPIK
jgi:hypothetical protein